MSNAFKLLSSFECGEARERADRPWRYGAINSKTVVFGQSSNGGERDKRTRCRACGGKIAPGEPCVEFASDCGGLHRLWRWCYVHALDCRDAAEKGRAL